MMKPREDERNKAQGRDGGFVTGLSISQRLDRHKDMLSIAIAIVLAFVQTGDARPYVPPARRSMGGRRHSPEPAGEVQLSWEWTLDRQFLRLTFVNQMGTVRRFEGHAYYRATSDGRYRGTWFDNSGMVRPIEARRDGTALVATWGIVGRLKSEKRPTA